MTAQKRTTEKQLTGGRVAEFLAVLEAHPKLLAFFFGLCFGGLMLILAIGLPQPTAFQYTVFRITLALAAAGVAGVIPGMIRLKVQPTAKLLIHAGGALAVFVIVYFVAPADLKPQTGKSEVKQESSVASNIPSIEKKYIELLQEKHRKYFQEELKRQELEKKLANLQQSYDEKPKRHKAADEALVYMKGQLPDEQIKKAKASLEQGDTSAAEQAFDAVVDKKSWTVALAAYQSGQLARGRLDYKKALRQYKKAISLDEDNPEYLFAAGQTALTMADYKHAGEWLGNLLKIRESGKDELALVRALNELAVVYDKLGQYSEAEPLQKRALAIGEKLLGKEHPDVAAILDNLAGLYKAQDRYEEAEPLQKRALEIREKTLGKEHPDVAQSLNNLATLYQEQGRDEKAEPLLQRALTILKAKFPNGHPLIDTVQANYDKLKHKLAEQAN